MQKLHNSIFQNSVCPRDEKKKYRVITIHTHIAPNKLGIFPTPRVIGFVYRSCADIRVIFFPIRQR